jgi:putative SOS response-associated peptidase YedK
MPVFLPKELWNKWLDPELTDTGKLIELVESREDDSELRYWPVRPLVNSIKNNGAALIEPLEPGDPETLF